MPEELLAISKISPPPAMQADYDAICAALMHTERGRWFLEEYAKRNRSADTKLLLDAIQRIEAVVCAERNRQAQQGLRTDLLEMAKAITRTRAEVAEIRAEGAPEQARPDDAASLPPRPRDVFAAAERIRDVTWAMRGHGFDPSTCDQLEELAGSILSASSLRDPTDRRASKLSQVLQYLERRIDTLLESCTDGDASAQEFASESASEPASEPDHQAIEPAVARQAKPANGFASAFVAEPVIEPSELEGVDFKANPASPPSVLGDALPAARLEVEDEVEDVAVEAVEVEAVAFERVDIDDGEAPAFPAGEMAPQEAPFQDRVSEPAIPAQNHELEAQSADRTPAAPGAVDCVASAEPASAEPVPAEPFVASDGDMTELPASAELVAASNAEPSAAASGNDPAAAAPAGPPPPIEEAPSLPSIADAGTATAARPQETPLPAVRLIDSSQFLPRSRELRATSAARSFLPEIDMVSSTPGLGAPSLGGSWARRVPPAASTPPHPPAATPPMPSPAPPSQTVAPAAAQAPQPDPLAGLKAMSDNELIALFS